MARPHVELAHADEIDPVPLALPGWPAGASVRTLSRDDETRGITGLVSLPGGWSRGPGALAGDHELFVVGGTLRVGGATRGWGWYEFTPGGGALPAIATSSGCELLLMNRGDPEFVPGTGDPGAGRIAVDSELLSWEQTIVAGHPPGVVTKVLRRVDATGETTILESIVRRWDYPVIEYHSCAEELFLIEGDMWLANSGTMRPGSYLWRPAFMTHGPFATRTGAVILAWLEREVDSIHVDDPRRPAAENRAEAERLRAHDREGAGA